MMKLIMKPSCLIQACLFLVASMSLSATFQIKLSTEKGRVIPSDERIIVLDFADTYLNHMGGVELELEGKQNPFSFEVPKEKDATPPEIKVVEGIPYNYTNRSILKLVSSSLSSKVKGLLEIGDKLFLQLEGGVVLSPDTYFPVILPNLENEKIRIKIESISFEGYELRLDETKLFFKFDFDSKEDSRIKKSK